jgi:hypothetical protein
LLQEPRALGVPGYNALIVLGIFPRRAVSKVLYVHTFVQKPETTRQTTSPKSRNHRSDTQSQRFERGEAGTPTGTEGVFVKQVSEDKGLVEYYWKQADLKFRFPAAKWTISTRAAAAGLGDMVLQ